MAKSAKSNAILTHYNWDAHLPDENGLTSKQAATQIARENPDATAVVKVMRAWKVCVKDSQGIYRAYTEGQYVRVPICQAADWFSWGSVQPLMQADADAYKELDIDIGVEWKD